jgi:Tfp pilus assembly protein PilF
MSIRNYLILGSAFLSLSLSFVSDSNAAPQPKKNTSPIKNQRGGNNAQVAKFKTYNEGVDLMMASAHARAQVKFEAVLKMDPNFAEAHNNLAYVLRKQGEDKYKEALKHYNKAITLKPQMAQAYMYRGVLFVQMNQPDKAKKDLETLQKLNKKLATELEYVLSKGKEKTPAKFFGVSGKLYK